MNRVFKIVLTIVILPLIIFFTGCSLDSADNNLVYKTSYGAVEREGNQEEGAISDDIFIRLDNGALLKVVEQLVSTKELENGSRLKFSYTEIGQSSSGEATGDKLRHIRLNNYTKLESDVVIRFSELEGVPIDEVWRDPIKIENIWLGGKYLNVDFLIRKGIESKEIHDVRLLYDDINRGTGTEVESEVARIYIKHNANGDVSTQENISSMVTEIGFISFDILSLIPQGSKSVKLEICWLEERDGNPLDEVVLREIKGEFTPYQGNIYWNVGEIEGLGDKVGGG